MEDNLYELLKLAPEVSDAQVSTALDEAIRKKKALLTRKASLKPEVEKLEALKAALVANPGMLREHKQKYQKIMQQKRAEQEKDLRADANVYAQGDQIEEARLNELVNRYKAFTRDEILHITGLKIKKEKQFTWQPTGKGAFMPDSVYKSICASLEKLGKRSLYDFLNVSPNASAAEITRACDAASNANQVRANNAEKTNIGDAIGHCKTTLLNPTERANYDFTLDNMSFKEVKEQIERLAKGTNKIIQPANYKALLEGCTKKGIPLNKAEYLIYDTAKSLGLQIVEGSSEEMVQCRFCGALNSHDAALCKSCAMPMVVTCPNCRRKSTNPEELRCTQCGFEIGEMPQSNVYLDLAAISLDNGNASQAKTELEKAIAFWNANPKIKSIADRVNTQYAGEAQNLAKVRELCQKKLYYAAKALAPKMGYGPEAATLREAIEQKINDARTLVQRAQQTVDANAKIDLYMQALQTCADCSEANDKLRLTPPAPPSQVNAKVIGNTVRVEWTKLPLNYLEYYVVRKANGRPVSKTDGDVVCQTSNPQFDDTRIDPGVSYYYAVYSKCGEIMSQQAAVTSAPVMTIGEISPKDVNIDVKEREIAFNIKFPPHAAKVEVYRDGQLAKTLTGSSWIDSGLTTDHEYTYKFVAVYVDAAKREQHSPGVTMKFKPTAPPKPVTINIQESGQSFRLSWQTPPRGTVVVYTSKKPFEILEGNKVNVDTLKYQQVDAINGTFQVSKSFSGIKYYIPITIVGNVGVAGAPVKLTSVMEPKNVQFARNNDYIQVSWSWDGVDAIRLIVKPEGGREQQYDIRSNVDSRFRVDIPSSCKSISLSLASLVVEGSETILSRPVEKVISLQSVKVMFNEAKSEAKFGFIGKNKFSITLVSPSYLTCDLCLLVGEDSIPVDLVNHTRQLIISASEVRPNVPLKKEFEYDRMSKKSTLYFRLTPEDRAFSKQVIVIPESRKI